jgi:hypothetical protein
MTLMGRNAAGRTVTAKDAEDAKKTGDGGRGGVDRRNPTPAGQKPDLRPPGIAAIAGIARDRKVRTSELYANLG